MTHELVRSALREALPDLTLDLADEMATAVLASGHLPGLLVVRCREAAGSTDALLRALTGPASSRALAPVSGYRVGAAVQSSAQNGEPCGPIYLGANLEFESTALHHTLHAEQAAVNHAWLSGATRIERVATNAPPCGHCRQFLWEVGGTIQVVVRGETNTDSRTRPLSELIPDAFGPKDLGVERRLLDPVESRLTDPDPDPAGDRGNRLGTSGTSVGEVARHAARASYAPYSGIRAGAAIELADGSVWPGRYAENAAFNPTILPVTSALSLARMRGWEPEQQSILRAVLVTDDANTHTEGARAVLRAWDPAREPVPLSVLEDVDPDSGAF